MKKILVLSLMLMVVGLLSVTMVIAEGVQEGQDPIAPAAGPNPYYSSEKLSLEGTVELTAAGVKLKASDGQVYDLMYPRFLADGIEIEDGQRISVEGYQVPGPRWESDQDELHLRVDRVTIDGQEYNLASNFGPAYKPHHRAYGPGYAPSYGPGAGRLQTGGYGGRGPGMMGRW